MGYKFNPFTMTLDYFESGTTAAFGNDDKVVDAGFLISREITLSAAPITDSELVYLNGLLLGKTCYTIVVDKITFGLTLPFKVGHYIDIRYAA